MVTNSNNNQLIKTIDFSKYSSIKCGPIVDVVAITSKDQIPKDHKILGLANNLLVSPNAKNLMMLSKEFSYVKIENEKLIIGAATPTGKVVSFCKKNNIGGFEFLAGLPGSMGGVIKMNAGLLGYEIFDNLLTLTTQNETFFKKDITYEYRNACIKGVIFEAAFIFKDGFEQHIVDMIKNKRADQPKEPSAGSCFKNPQGDYAGRLIEAVGLKGYKKGDFCFSTQHANFLVNLGSGKFEDALWLIEEAKKRVKKEFGIELKEEIDIIKA